MLTVIQAHLYSCGLISELRKGKIQRRRRKQGDKWKPAVLLLNPDELVILQQEAVRSLLYVCLCL
jgi:hypothetical protein